MRAAVRITALAISAIVAAACGDREVVSPANSDVVSFSPAFATASSYPEVRISQFHYDNTSTDVGEAIEVSAPAGTNLSGYQLVLYNGSGGAPYNTRDLSGIVPATCGTRGVVKFDYPRDGIQNGAPDGIALIHNGVVVEFISYEGAFTAVGGAANGLLSTDVGVFEPGNALNTSIRRLPEGSNPGWAVGPEAWGTCPDQQASRHVTLTASPAVPSPGQTVILSAVEFENGTPKATSFTYTSSDPARLLVPDPSVGSAIALAGGSVQVTATAEDGTSATIPVTIIPEIRISELHYDNDGIDVGEQVEIDAPAYTDLAGWRVLLYNGNGGVIYSAIALSGVVPSRCAGRGVLAFDIPGVQNGPDAIALVSAAGEVVEFISYEGTVVATEGPANGLTATDMGVSESSSTPLGKSLSRTEAGTWALADASFGRCNFGDVPPATVTVSYLPSPVRVGNSVQFSASETDAQGQPVATAFTYASNNAARLTIDAVTGQATAHAEGTVTVRATAADGTIGQVTLTVLGPPRNTLDITIDGLNDLPAGFTKQILVVKYVDENGLNQPRSEITYESRDPAIASLDGFYVDAHSPGNVWIVARGANDAIDSTIVRVQEFTLAGPHDYSQGNAEFGIPADADPADDLIIERQQYTLSYNAVRGGPNWVSWVVNATHFDQAVPRCDCFTADPAVPAGSAIHHRDYTGSGYSRGHMAMSEQRTSTFSENAASFYMTNMLPQHQQNNGGPWLNFESFVNAQAAAGREVYNIAGGIYLPGSETFAGGRVTAPSYTWKVVVILPRGQGIEHVTSYQQLEVYAVRMPNDRRTGVPGSITELNGNDWHNYETTVDALEAQTGYDLLALLPDHIEILVESRTRPPVAAFTATAGALAGESVTFSAAGSSDPDGDALTFAWSFGDGGTGAGETVSHTYAVGGTYRVQLVVTDVRGVADTTATSLQVLSPDQVTLQLMQLVKAARDGGSLSVGNATSLLAKLNAVQDALGNGSTTAARPQLEAFLNEVDALVRTGRLDPGIAEPWRALARRLLLVL